jgi:hypothetical protein
MAAFPREASLATSEQVNRAARQDTRLPAGTIAHETLPEMFCRPVPSWGPVCLSIEREADLHRNLPMTDLPVLNVAARFDDLKPAKIAQRFGGTVDRIADCVFYRIGRTADQFDLLVDMVAHEGWVLLVVSASVRRTRVRIR